MPNVSPLSRLRVTQYGPQNRNIFTQLLIKVLTLSRHLYKASAIFVLNALIVFAAFELAAKSAIEISHVFSKPTKQLTAEGNPREKVSYYASQNWAERYWHEFWLSRKVQYYPYVGWRRAPFKGETIEIDQNGVRVTPDADCRANSFKVFTFGASEMWGTGAPNWETIPAYLQQGLEKLQQRPVCVMNFAEAAYVSMQDVIMLLMQLRSGNVPDVVLFYNIGSDIYAAYQSGRAGVHQNLDRLAAKFDGPQEPPRFADQFIDWLRRRSSYALVYELIGKLSIANPQHEDPTPSKLVNYESMGIPVAPLSEAIVQHYLANDKIVSGLAQTYGFKYFFFLPPRIFRGNKPLTAEEQAMKYKAETEAAFFKLYIAVYQILEREASQDRHLYSMTHIFDHYDSLIWIDEVHVTPIGNQLIATSMLDVIAEELR